MKLVKYIYYSNPLKKIIYCNILIFILIHIFIAVYFLIDVKTPKAAIIVLEQNLGVPSNFNTIIKKPWTIITYMFSHFDFFHALINFCWLYFAGKIFTNYLNTHNLISTYIMGGIIGAVVYIIAFNIFPIFDNIKHESYAIGASAAVLAILFASATYVPNFTINILMLGKIKLKYIALLAIIIDILSITKGNAGSHIAHIGGAFYGYIYIYMKNRNINTNYIIDQILLFFDKKNTLIYNRENDYEYNARKKAEQQKIDKILDKISRSGYDSLSSEEKKVLFNQK